MKKITVLILLFFEVCCNAKDASDYPKEVIINRDKLKDIAFCHCLLLFFPNDSLLQNDFSQDFYIQSGAHGMTSISRIIEYTEKYVSKNNAPSPQGQNLFIKACIDLRNSSQLDSLVVTMDSELVPWLIKK